MTGSVALDVVIGLVFLYLLYSLYATIVLEIWATFMSLRARNLRRGIERMLDDEKNHISNWQVINFGKEAWERIRKGWRVFSTPFGEIKDDKLSAKFYKQPLIKYLGAGRFYSKPSYLSAQNFSKAVMDSLKEGSDESTILTKLKDGINAMPDGETRKHLLSLLEDANNDLDKFKLLLEKWFDDTMERVIGWYKRRTQTLLLLIGFILAVAFNANTIDLFKKLAKDDDARNQLVSMANTYVESNPEVVAYVDGLRVKRDTAVLSAVDSIKLARLDTLLQIRDSLQADIRKANSLVQAGWGLPDSLAISWAPCGSKSKDSLCLALPVKWVADKVKKDTTIYLAVARKLNQKALQSKFLWWSTIDRTIEPGQKHVKVSACCYALRYVFQWQHVWGYLLTALAISLGAPFWFDLLNKLMKLRSTGSATTETEKKKA